MKQIHHLAVAIITLFISGNAFSEWQQLGDTLNINELNNASGGDIAVDDTTPYVVMAEEGEGYVKWFNGSYWQILGAAINNTMNAFIGGQITLDGSNIIVLVNEKDSLTDERHLCVKEWSGSEWQQISEKITIDSGKTVYGCSFCSSGSVAYVAWSEMITIYEVDHLYVKKWNGIDWEMMGVELNVDPDSRALEPSVVLIDQTPHVAWVEYGTGYAYIYVKYWDGLQWLQKGSAIFEDADQYCNHPSITINNGIPYVTWFEREDNIYVRYWNGTEWTPMPGKVVWDPGGQAAPYRPRLAFLNDDTYIMWSAMFGVIRMKKYLGQQWSDDIEVPYNNASSESGGKLVAGSDALYLAMSEGATSVTNNLFVKKYIPPTATPTISPTATNTPLHTPTITPTRYPGMKNGGWAEPNPFFPEINKTVKFVLWSDSDTIIRILNIKGRTVRTLHNQLEWDGRSDSGQLCEGGVYIYQIEAEGKRMTGKVVLIK